MIVVIYRWSDGDEILIGHETGT